MAALTITLLYTDVFSVGHVPVTSSSLIHCANVCYYKNDCSTFFYGRNECYCSATYNQALPFDNGTEISEVGINYFTWTLDQCPSPFAYYRPTDQCLYGEWVNKKNQNDAISFCQSIGGRLAILDTSYKTTLLANFGLANEATLWIGALRSGGAWRWVRGDTIGPFTDWYSNPDVSVHNCAIMSRVYNQWIPYNCSAQFRFICEKIIPTAQKPCGLLTLF